ncbi:tRNA-splicing endonuclease subunit sen54 [Neophaeococcomyces mojaviensis]|uniref:tRNA-splicing endonuclease subunit sen54 n=1 Tax=Neophaeococcomyces mojaviensis TaxID=3383035 RepID=A0ACC2ZR22_9EURO|nr:tRNA-splicing endonuclease subunit sen54 [Knufia sp. JES_112]
MADADEDLMPSSTPSSSRPAIPGTTVDDDNASISSADSDTAPDYLFLASATSKDKSKLPARGTKDFEPNPTARQTSSLDASRRAMGEALGVVRIHGIKTGMIGIYFPNPDDWDGKAYDAIGEEEKDRREGLDEEVNERVKRYRKSGGLRPGEGRCVAVERFASTHVRTMGQTDRRNWVWLLPEEALFLLERGSLDVRWAVEGDDDEEEETESVVVGGVDAATMATDDKQWTVQEGDSETTPAFETIAEADLAFTKEQVPRLKIGKIPMSLQGAYASLIGKSGLTLERYIVYANLKRAGYIVQRAPTWHGLVEATQNSSSTTTSIPSVPVIPDVTALSRQQTNPIISLFTHLFSWLFTTNSSQQSKPFSTPCYNPMFGPLISTGLFRSYGDIYRQLYLIPHHDYSISDTSPLPSLSTQSTETSAIIKDERLNEPALFPSYDLFKPSLLSTYRKSAPPPPSFRLVVLDSRSPATNTIPTSRQIGDLLALMPHSELPKEKRLETRIKHGKRNCLLAVVDSGLVSYLRVSSGGFTEGGLWEENERRRQQTGSGKRGGGNRGRGRGGRRGRGRGRGQGS